MQKFKHDRHDILRRIVKRMKERFVSWSFESCNTCTISFDHWMLRGGVNTFVLIMYFLNDKWEPCYIIERFFEIVNTSRSAMVLQVNNVLENMGLKFLFLHMSKMKGVIFHHYIYINLTYVSWNFWIVDTFCRVMLGPRNGQMLSICHKWFQDMCWLDLNFNIKKHILCKKSSLWQRKVVRDGKNGMWTCKGASM
jgi:hypothetical protein